MPASITDLQNELEQINASMQTLVGIQTRAEAVGRTAAGAPGNGAGGGFTGEDKSFMLGMMKQYVTGGKFGIIEQAKTAIKIGYTITEQVDTLIMSNLADGRNTREILREVGDEIGHQYGGLLENVELATTAQEKGLPLFGHMNKRLRNQLTELDKQGAQGRLLLNYIKDLSEQGFEKGEVKEVIQRLADIGFYSIQSANSQTAMLKMMTKTLAITTVADPKFGKNLTQALTDFMMDAPEWGKRSGIQRLQEIVLPENMEQLMLRGQLGGKGFREELKIIAEEMAGIRERGKLAKEANIPGGMKIMEEGLKATTRELEEIVYNYTLGYRNQLMDQFEGLGEEQIYLLSQVPYFKEQMDQTESLNATLRGMEMHWATQEDRLNNPGRYAAQPGMIGAAAEAQWALTTENLHRYAEVFKQRALSQLEDTNQEIKELMIDVLEPLFTMSISLAKLELWGAAGVAWLLTFPMDLASRALGATAEGTGFDILKNTLEEQAKLDRQQELLYGYGSNPRESILPTWMRPWSEREGLFKED